MSSDICKHFRSLYFLYSLCQGKVVLVVRSLFLKTEHNVNNYLLNQIKGVNLLLGKPGKSPPNTETQHL